MEARPYGCVVCGYIIRDQTTKYHNFWESAYRVLVHELAGPRLTGVAYFDGSADWTPPSDPAVRQDLSHTPTDADEVIPVMTNFQPNAERHGYVLHDSCWLLLEAFWGRGNVPIGRLLEVLQSLPFPVSMNGLLWGNHHDDLLFTEDAVEIWPWQSSEFQPRELGEHRWVAADPFYWPDMEPSFDTGQDIPRLWKPKRATTDCFSALPWEVRELVALDLNTTDALSLRLASLSYQPLLWNGAFWASRVMAGNEHDFLFEMRARKEPIDWLGLYRSVRSSACPAGLRSRKRIWELIRCQSELLSLRLAGSNTSPEDVEGHIDDWVRVGALLNHFRSEHNTVTVIEGATIWNIRVISIPRDLSAIGFSMTSSETLGFVTGMRFIASTGPDVCAGFISDMYEVRYTVRDFMGLKLAMGKRGLKAVQVLHKDGTCSNWFGYPRGSPVSSLFANCEIEKLEVAVDVVKPSFPIPGLTADYSNQGYKIVRLGVQAQQLIHADVDRASLTLRQRELWFHDVPPPSLCLNEDSFMGNKWYTYNHLPLQWIHFGGPGGRRLRHLTGLSFMCKPSLERLCGITFLYDRSDATSTQEDFTWGSQGDLFSKPKFNISGAHGEYLETLELGVWRKNFRGGFNMLRTVKVTTNWNRSYQCGTAPGEQMERVTAAQGTVITGFYASQAFLQGMNSIGIISEVVKSP